MQNRFVVSTAGVDVALDLQKARYGPCVERACPAIARLGSRIGSQPADGHRKRGDGRPPEPSVPGAVRAPDWDTAGT